MKSLLILVILLVLIIVTISFLVLIVRNKRLPINGKIFWAAIVIFLPIIGGVIYFTRKGEANA